MKEPISSRHTKEQIKEASAEVLAVIKHITDKEAKQQFVLGELERAAKYLLHWKVSQVIQSAGTALVNACIEERCGELIEWSVPEWWAKESNTDSSWLPYVQLQSALSIGKRNGMKWGSKDPKLGVEEQAKKLIELLEAT